MELKNIGKRDGSEVVQLYVSHSNTDEKAPIHSLQTFEKVFLKAGESTTVTFELTPKNLALVNHFGNLIQKQGDVDVYIGGGQPNKAKTVKTTINIKGTPFEIIR